MSLHPVEAAILTSLLTNSFLYCEWTTPLFPRLPDCPKKSNSGQSLLIHVYLSHQLSLRMDERFIGLFCGVCFLFCLSPTQIFALKSLSHCYQLRPAQSGSENPFAQGAQEGNFGAYSSTQTDWHHSGAAEKMWYSLTASAKCGFPVSTATMKLLKGE